MLTGLSTGPASGLDPAEIYARWGAGVVTVVGARTQGSGFVIPYAGYIVTNQHVVAGQSKLFIILPTKERRAVTSVLKEDAVRDLAVLSADSTGLPRVVLGDSGGVRVGERVVAIGTPLLLSQTVSEGIISQIRTDQESGITLLQTTTPISAGSSGGPLFNSQGEVIGVTTATRIGGQNLNFAVAINELRRLIGEPVSTRPRTSDGGPQERLPAVLQRSVPAGYSVHLWNGSIFAADSYREIGETIIYERGGGAVTIPRQNVARIVRLEDGSVRQISSVPPPTRESVLTEPRVDIEDILMSRRTTPSPRTEAPSSGPVVARGECAGLSEDFSSARWRVLAPSVVRFDHPQGNVLIDIRGIRMSVPDESHVRRLIEGILTAGSHIMLANRQVKEGGRSEATLCVDGRDIAEHPSLEAFRNRPAFAQ